MEHTLKSSFSPVVCPANEEGSLDSDIISLAARKDTTVLRPQRPQRFTPNYFSMGVCLASHVMPGKGSFLAGDASRLVFSRFLVAKGRRSRHFSLRKNGRVNDEKNVIGNSVITIKISINSTGRAVRARNRSDSDVIEFSFDFLPSIYAIT